MRRLAVPFVLLLVLSVLAFVFPGAHVQVGLVILSIVIPIYMVVLLTNVETYRQERNRLFRGCDEIKNDVANHRVLETEEFGRRLVKCLADTPRCFEVDGVVFKAIDSGYVFSDRAKVTENIPIEDYSGLEILARQGKVRVILEGGPHRLGIVYRSVLLVPIMFGDSFLGYFLLGSRKKKFGDLDVSLFEELEDYLIDDAIYSLRDRRVIRRIAQLEAKLDEVTNEVALGRVTDLGNFAQRLTAVFVSELPCAACYLYVKPDVFAMAPKSTAWDLPLCERIESALAGTQRPQVFDGNDPNIANALVSPVLVAVPIMLEDNPLGSLGVFLNDEADAAEVASIVEHIENSVLDNYVSMLKMGRIAGS